MLNILDKKLNALISDKIYYYIRRDFMRNLKYTLYYNTVWILTDDKISFLILEKNNNYYSSLQIDNIPFNISYNKKKIYK